MFAFPRVLSLKFQKKIAANLRRAFSLIITLTDFLQAELGYLNAKNHRIDEYGCLKINKIYLIKSITIQDNLNMLFSPIIRGQKIPFLLPVPLARKGKETVKT
jgi:voltage-gated potassium channel Kch